MAVGCQRSAGVGAAVDTVAEVWFEMSEPQWRQRKNILPACCAQDGIQWGGGKSASLFLREI